MTIEELLSGPYFRKTPFVMALFGNYLDRSCGKFFQKMKKVRSSKDRYHHFNEEDYQKIKVVLSEINSCLEQILFKNGLIEEHLFRQYLINSSCK